MRSIRFAILLFILAALTAYTYLLRFKPVSDMRLPMLERIPKTVEGFTAL